MIGKKTAVTIKQSAKVSDGMGSYTESWSDLITSLKGTLVARRISDRFAGERLANGVIKTFSSHLFMCNKPSTAITEAHRLYDVNNDVYEIVFVNNIALQDKRLILELRKVE